MDSVRMDKWLWAARFFKTRPLAVKACELGRVEIGGQRVKPARDARVGEQLTIRTEAGTFVVDVLALSDTRGPASVAQTLYAETDASRTARDQERQQRAWMQAAGGLHDQRPDKRERRQTGRVRGRG